MTGQASLDSAVNALRRGVSDYLTKPVDFSRLQSILSEVAQSRDLKKEIGGITTLMAIDALDADPGTERVVLISKPPHPDVAKAVIAVLDWNLDPQAAVDLPNLGNRNGATELEEGTPLARIAPALEAMGHEIKLATMTSGLAAILVTPDGLLGGADRRRKGIALGD